MFLDKTQNQTLKDKSGIYQIRNLVDGKIYVGSAFNLLKRRAQHRCRLNSKNHGNCHLQNAWNKYGENNFVFEVLEFIPLDNEILKKRETYYIQKLNVCDRSIGYNLSPDALRNTLCEESKQKIREKVKGNQNWLGKRHTEETKKRMSEWHTGKVVKQSTRDKLSKINQGVPKWTEEQKRQMSIARQGTNCGKDNPMYGMCGELNPFYGKHHTKELRDTFSKNRMGSLNPVAKPFMCIETGQKFGCMEEYKRLGGKYSNNIRKCCKGLISDVNGYHWKYICKEELDD